MENLHCIIISERMVWLWYYDKLGGKHIKELLEDDAREYVKKMGNQVQIGTEFVINRTENDRVDR